MLVLRKQALTVRNCKDLLRLATENALSVKTPITKQEHCSLFTAVSTGSNCSCSEVSKLTSSHGKARFPGLCKSEHHLCSPYAPSLAPLVTYKDTPDCQNSSLPAGTVPQAAETSQHAVLGDRSSQLWQLCKASAHTNKRLL